MSNKPLVKRAEQGLTKMQDAVGDLFNRFFEGWDIIPSLEGRTWWPMLDVADHENEIVVRAELPGMKPENFDLSVQGNVLTISGEKSEEAEEKKENYYHTERRFGSFRRDIHLPGTVDVEKIEATYENGILSINLPKTEEAKPKKLKIHVREPVASH